MFTVVNFKIDRFFIKSKENLATFVTDEQTYIHMHLMKGKSYDRYINLTANPMAKAY